MKYQRKPAVVEAAQVNQDLTVADGTVIPAGHWLVIHADGHTTAVNDADFTADYEPVPAEAVAEPAPAEQPAPAVDENGNPLPEAAPVP